MATSRNKLPVLKSYIKYTTPSHIDIIIIIYDSHKFIFGVKHILSAYVRVWIMARGLQSKGGGDREAQTCLRETYSFNFSNKFDSCSVES